MKHFYEEIEGWFQFSKPYLEAVASARDGAVFVELGCWKGRSASFMGVEIVNSGKAIEFNCVDHWKGSDDVHLLVVMTSERGLAGGFNTNIVKLARTEIRRLQAAGKTVKILTIGKKGSDALKRVYGSLIVGHIDRRSERTVTASNANLILDVDDDAAVLSALTGLWSCRRRRRRRYL